MKDPATIGEAIEAWAQRTPDAPALLEPGREPLSYGALAELCRQFRSDLNASGFGRDDRLALVHPGGAALAAATSAVWASAVAVPLNPAYTEEEFENYFTRLKVDCLLIAVAMDSPARQAADRHGIPVLEIAEQDGGKTGAVALQQRANEPARQPGPTEPEDLAMVVFTSGTTDRPKVVPRKQRHTFLQGKYFTEAVSLSPSDRGLNMLPLYHSAGLHHTIGAIAVSGGSMIHMPRFDVTAFFDCLSTLRPTWYFGTPTHHREILSYARRRPELTTETSLRFIRSGTAHMPADLFNALEDTFKVPVSGGYGSSESGHMANNGTTFETRKWGSVGRKSFNDVEIMDADGNILPVGETGEVVTRGPLVFDGYEDDPAATAAAFIDGWYHTGDEGLFDEDGFLFLTGRIKEIINRGGTKISPVEVDTVLQGHPDVADAVTFPIPHPTLGEEVAAAVVPKTNVSIDEKSLAEFARTRLASFKVPRRFLIVDEIPKRATTGKVQRSKLAQEFGIETPADALRVNRMKDDGRHV